MFKKLLVMIMLFSASAAMCMETVTIQPQGGQDFIVDVKLAKLSKTIHDLIEDAGTDNPIPLLNVTGLIWTKIQTLLPHVRDIKSGAQDAQQKKDIIITALKSLDGPTLIEFIAAANYLDIPILLSEAIDVAKQVDIKKINSAQIAALPKEIRNLIISAQMIQILGPWKGKQLELKGRTNDVTSVYATPDGAKIVAGFLDGTLRIWDIQNGKQLAEIQGRTSDENIEYEHAQRQMKAGFVGGPSVSRDVTSVYVTSDGAKIVSGFGDGTIRIWDINDLKKQPVVLIVDKEGSISIVGVTPDGKKIVSIRAEHFKGLPPPFRGEINVLDINIGTRLATLKFADSTNLRAVLTPDGTKLIVNIGDKTIRILDSNNLTQLFEFNAPNFALPFNVTPDSTKIVSGSGDNTIRIWDIKNGMQLDEFTASAGKITSIQVTPDGSKIVASFKDNIIHVLDINNGAQLGEFTGHVGGIVNSIYITPDSSKIVSVSWNDILRVWDISLFRRISNMNSQQAQAICNYLQGGHKDGWNGIYTELEKPIAVTPAVGPVVPTPYKKDDLAASLNKLQENLDRLATAIRQK